MLKGNDKGKNGKPNTIKYIKIVSKTVTDVKGLLNFLEREIYLNIYFPNRK